MACASTRGESDLSHGTASKSSDGSMMRSLSADEVGCQGGDGTQLFACMNATVPLKPAAFQK